MTLKEWMEKYDIPHDAICERLQVSRTHLYAILAERQVGLELGLMIMAMTNNEVSINDLLSTRKKLPAGELAELKLTCKPGLQEVRIDVADYAS